MSKEKIFSGNTVEEVAQAFAEIVKRNHIKSLEFWKVTAMDDLQESIHWELRLETEPKKIERNAYDKILKIMKEPQENKKYYKKWWFTTSKDVINITSLSGFYKDLLPRKDFEWTVPLNVEYIINKKRFTITKKIYPQKRRMWL